MNYSVEYIASKITESLVLTDKYQHEIRTLRKSISGLRCQPVINAEGEVVSYSDFEN